MSKILRLRSPFDLHSGCPELVEWAGHSTQLAKIIIMSECNESNDWGEL